MNKKFWKHVDELLERVRKSRLQGKAIMDSALRRMYGFSIDDKFRTVDDAVNALYDDTDKKLCALALLALSVQWKLDVDSEYIPRIKQLAITESNDDLRGAALQSLGAIFERTNDRQIGIILATVIRDESEPAACRRGAHDGLRCLGGCDDDDLLPFPESVDWGFVDSFLHPGAPD